MNWPLSPQDKPTLSQIQQKNHSFRNEIRNKQVQQFKNHLRQKIIIFKNNHHSNPLLSPPNPYPLQQYSHSFSFSLPLPPLSVSCSNPENIFDHLDQLLNQIIFCPHKLESHHLANLQFPFFQINQVLVELRKETFQWQFESSLYYEAYIKKLETYDSKNGQIIIQKMIDYLLTVQFLTLLELSMIENAFILILEDKINLQEDQYYKCYQLILHFFKSLQEESLQLDTVELENIPLFLIKSIIVKGIFLQISTPFHLQLQAKCLLTLIDCFSQNRQLYFQIQAACKEDQSNLKSSVIMLIEKVKDIIVVEEIDLINVNRNILKSVEILMKIDENNEFGEYIRWSFLPKYLLACIFFQPHAEIEMKTLSLIFQVRERYGIEVDRQNCLQLHYQETGEGSETGGYYRKWLKLWK